MRAGVPSAAASDLRAVGGGNAHLFLLAFALARRLQKAEYRLGNVGITNEYPFTGRTSCIDVAPVRVR